MLLDVFSGAGGAAMGYHRAGFDVVGIDLRPQPGYPFTCLQGDALDVLRDLAFVRLFDAVNASPPCQRYTRARVIRNRKHPDLIPVVRRLLRATGLPYVIENVEGAPLRDPVMLCGTSFGLRTYRHRLFESNVALREPRHGEHLHPVARIGRPVRRGEFHSIIGNFSDVKRARTAMGIPWMMRDEMNEAIPPAYTEYIGRQLRRAL
jgi:DNA (cytosine-5)-methyltransferase 1